MHSDRARQPCITVMICCEVTVMQCIKCQALASEVWPFPWISALSAASPSEQTFACRVHCSIELGCAGLPRGKC